MSARKIACVALLAASSIALAACESGPETPPTPTPAQSQEKPTSSAAPTQSSSSSPKETEEYKPASAKGPAENVPIPKMPAQASENTAEGAAHFAEYYFELINYLVESNDSTPLKRVTSRACELCGEYLIDPAARAQVSGKWQVGGEHKFRVTDSYMSAKNKAAVSMAYSIDEAEFYFIPNELDSTEKSTDSMRLTLAIEYANGWKVQKIIIIEDRKS